MLTALEIIFNAAEVSTLPEFVLIGDTINVVQTKA
jgi:hypothetical protein